MTTTTATLKKLPVEENAAAYLVSKADHILVLHSSPLDPTI